MDDESLSTGFKFYKKIGSPKLIVAPMVDQSELCYRMQTRKYGAQLVYTQMFNANSFVTSQEYREANFTTCIYDRPLIVQFGGHDPTVLLQAAKYVEHLCDGIDINIGCPQHIAKRGHYGAYLMEELDLLHDIVSTLSKNLSIPITCKSRIYKSFEDTIRLYDALIHAGASFLTIHGRTREEKGHNIKEVDWEMIRRIKEYYGNRIPIIANGGIEVYNDIQACLDYTKCDGVMVSEAILENPAFFIQNIYEGKYLTQLFLAEEYLNMTSFYPVWHFKSIRSHYMKVLHRYFTVHTELRDIAANCSTIDTLYEIIQKLNQYTISKHTSDVVELLEPLSQSSSSLSSSSSSSTSTDNNNNNNNNNSNNNINGIYNTVIRLDSSYTETWYRRHRKYYTTCTITGTGEAGELGQSGGSGDRLTYIRQSQQAVINQRPKIWDDDSGCMGLFDGLGMFQCTAEEDEEEAEYEVEDPPVVIIGGENDVYGQ